PEGFLRSIGISDTNEPFTAEIEVEPRALERPLPRHLDLWMLKPGDPLAIWPGFADHPRRTVKGPSIERYRVDHHPLVKLDQALLEPRDALFGSECHSISYPE